MLEAIRNKRQTVLLGVVLTIALSGPIAAGITGRIKQLRTDSETAIRALKCLGQKALAQRNTNLEPN